MPASTIYSYTNADGDKKYYYTPPNQGDLKNSKPSKAPKDAKIEATIHSHNADNNYSEYFSDADMNNARTVPEIYLVTGSGDLRKFNYDKLGKYAEDDRLWKYGNDACTGEPVYGSNGYPLSTEYNSTNKKLDLYNKRTFLFFWKVVKP